MSRSTEIIHHGVRFTPKATNRVQVTRVADGRNIADFPIDGPCTYDEVNDAALAWIAEQVGANPPPERRCDGCDVVLVPVFNDDTTVQFSDALSIKFSGGYGMFIDPIDDHEAAALDVLVCGKCATALAATFPWAATALGTDQTSH